jgi:integrase
VRRAVSVSVSVSKRERTRPLVTGGTTRHIRYVVNVNDAKTGKRRQLFFRRHQDALAKRDEIVAQVQTGGYADANHSVTVADAVRRWLENRDGEVKARTFSGYQHVTKYIVGPILKGSTRSRQDYAKTAVAPDGAELLPLLGATPIAQLTTADIRSWHKLLTQEVGAFTANRAKQYLATSLALAAEDYGIRPPPMPLRLGKGRARQKKAILTPEQIALVLREAQTDKERGIYYAFPFLAGTRPSEQLALLWEDVDFEANVIHIRRMQEQNGEITNLTKTVAGTRDIPMGPTLRTMLLDWRDRCPHLADAPPRVFPGIGFARPWPLPRVHGGGPLLLTNFRKRFWAPALQRLGLPHVSPHSARHSFISTLQAQGIEVGLVAKIAGHANVNVTLGHYTQAVRGIDKAIGALEHAYGIQPA